VPILEAILEEPVAFVPDVLAGEAPSHAGCVLLENLRFYPGEEANTESFAKDLARWGDFYMNEAFSVSHRAHASIVGVPALLPHAAGPLFLSELTALRHVTEHLIPPVLAIVGGGKISTKLGVLRNLLKVVSTLAVGGGLANTLLAAQGLFVGTSLQEPTQHQEAKKLLEAAHQQGCTLLLPKDVRVRTASGEVLLCSVEEVPEDAAILDIGPETAQRLEQEIAQAGTVLWNGPLGRFEESPFHQATERIFRAIAAETQRRSLVSVVGGGDSVAALNVAAMDFASFHTVSTSGGAFLEFLEGKELPGVQSLGL
jgi:phosphoglycerate kinase